MQNSILQSLNKWQLALLLLYTIITGQLVQEA